MNKKLIKYEIIGRYDVLKMYEHNSLAGPGRSLSFQYTSSNDCSETEVLEFRTTKIFDMCNYERPFFETLSNFYLLTKAPAEFNRLAISEELEEAIAYVTQGELYKIKGNRFYFRGDFTERENPFFDAEDINFKDCELTIEFGDWRCEFVIGYCTNDGYNDKIRPLFEIEKMRSDYREIYQTIRLYSFKKALSPQILLDQLKGNLL